MDLLARREHSLAELERKLGKRFGDSALLAGVLQGLAGENLQSDARYAESFARQRVSRGYGPLRLRQELRQKGLEDSQVTAALEALAVDWAAVARGVYHKKFGEAPPADLKEKARRMRFMHYRGFDGDLLQRLFDQGA